MVAGHCMHALLVGLLLFSGQTWGEGVQMVGRYIPQSPLLNTAPLFVDLDGDGDNEVVYLAESATASDLADTFVTVLKQEGDHLRPVDVFPVPAGGNRILPVPSADGVSRDLLVATGYWDTQVLRLGGVPLVLRESIPLPAGFTLVAADDFDADGGIELLLGNYGAHMLRMIDLEGTFRWQSFLLSPVNVAVAQLDNDPQLEILVGSNSVKVVAGATGEWKWEHPIQATRPLLAGRFESAPGVQTFALFNSTTTIFRSQPWAVLRSFGVTGAGLSATAIDIDTDGIDELIFPSGAQGFRVIDTMTGLEKPSVSTDFRNLRIPALGRINKTGPQLIAYGSTSGTTTNGRNGLRVSELATATGHYSADLEYGPFSMATFADIDGDGVHEIVRLSASRSHFSPTQIPLHVVVTTLDGVEIGRSQDTGLRWQHSATSSPPLPMLQVADLDGVPGDEIIVAGMGEWSLSRVQVLRGADLSALWTTDLLVDFTPVTLHGLKTADFDADGHPDPVVLYRKDLETRLLALSGVTGEELWQSIDLGYDWLSSSGLDVLQIDDDPAVEIAVSLGHAMFVFDASSRLLEWAVSDEQLNAHSTLAWGDNETCRTGIVTGLAMRVYSCDGQQRLADIGIPPATTRVIDELGNGQSFLATAGGKLYRVLPGKDPVALTGYLGADLDGNPVSGVRRMSQQSPVLEWLLGTVAQQVTLRVEFPDELLRDGFEVDAGGGK